MNEPTVKENPPRLRLAIDIDLSKAKRSCRGCRGTGIRGMKQIDDPEDDGQQIEVPIICKCVSRRGGVRADQLDRILTETAKEIEDGSFARNMATDIMSLSAEQQVSAVRQLKERAADRNVEQETREACFAALRLLIN